MKIKFNCIQQYSGANLQCKDNKVLHIEGDNDLELSMFNLMSIQVFIFLNKIVL